MNAATTPARFDEFLFDPADGRLEHLPSGQALALRPQAARLLLALLACAGEVVDRETLYQAVWDRGTVVDFEAGLAALMRELRQALDQLGGKAALLETIPRRGYRLRATAPSAPPPTLATQDPGGRTRAWRWILPVAAVLLALVAAWWLRAPGPQLQPVAGAGTGTAAARAMAVLPFQAYEQSEDAPRLELLLADAFLAELWRVELDGVVLIGRATVLPYAGRDDVAGAVARDLGVQLLVEGSVIRTAAGWQVTARLLEMPTGRVLWSDTVQAAAEKPLPVAALAEQLVGDLARAWPAPGE